MNQEMNKPAKRNAQGKKDQAPPPTPALKTVEPQTEEPNDASGKKKCGEKQRISWPARIEAACAVLLVFITGFYTYYASRQATAAIEAANAAKLSADTAAGQLESAERPWIFVKESRIVGPLVSDAAGAHITMLYVIHNSGNSPAINGEISAELYGQNRNKLPANVETQRLCDELVQRMAGKETFFPDTDTPFQITIDINRSDIVKSGELTSGYVALAPLVCIAYRPAFNATFRYYTGVTHLLLRPHGIKTRDMEPGTNIPIDSLELHPFPFGGALAK